MFFILKINSMPSSTIFQSPLSKPEKWKIRTDIIAVSIASLSFVFSVFQYNNQTSNNLKIQFKRERWMQKKEIYTNLCGVLGSMIAGIENDSIFVTEQKKFSALYYGGAKLVADPQVDSCMNEIKSALLKDFRYNNIDDLRDLRIKVGALDSFCRLSLERELNNL